MGKRASSLAPVSKTFKKNAGKFPAKSFGKSFKKPSTFQSSNGKWKQEVKPSQEKKPSFRANEPVCNVCFGPHEPTACQ